MFHVDVGFAGDGRRGGVRLEPEPDQREPQIFPIPFLQHRRVRHQSVRGEAARVKRDGMKWLAG